ncbi:unnamed protein product [Ectocarpus sp. 4 AP-2014]
MTVSNSTRDVESLQPRRKALNEDPSTRRPHSLDFPQRPNDPPSSSARPFKAMVAGKNYGGVYRYVGLGVWLFISTFMVLDRFYWNFWPRQTICTDGCGGDFFCKMDDDPGCLKDGPWSAKTFDVIARISARFIISTTNLMFITMCHGTWNYLSEVQVLRPFLYAWRTDNFWLHSIGGWTMGIWTMLHVYSLLLPSIFHGFKNVAVGGPVELPLQVSLAVSNVDLDNKLANWGYDDIWRIIWMTLIFCVLTPLSRSAWALKKNFTLAMWLHIGVGIGYFFDNWRRRTHPHVWILNTPVFLWYIADKVWCCTRGRVDDRAETTRISLDEDYMLLLWDEEHPKRICDIFWLKHRDSDGTEMAHPFTTCSSHDTLNKQATTSGTAAVKTTIEVPTDTSVHWKGHRFLLASSSGQRSNATDSKRRSVRSFFSGSSFVAQGSFGRVSSFRFGQSNPMREARLVSSHTGSSQDIDVDSFFEEDETDKPEETTMIGVDSNPDIDEVSIMVGGLKPKASRSYSLPPLGTIRGGVAEVGTTKDGSGVNAARPDTRVQKETGSDVGGPNRREVIRRLSTKKFKEYRKAEAEEGRLETIEAGSWSKMAIVKVNRRTSKARKCSCMGLTFILSIFRDPETSSIADLEAAQRNASLELRTYGPYRSEYGRLAEFPHLPPLLIVATGAGAALVLDFIGYVRANNIVPLRPVSVCYSSASLALLQFVTNTLLAERSPGIHIQTALTRHDDLEIIDSASGPEPELVMGRLDIKKIIGEVSQETEVYFCGGGGINALLRETCTRRGIKYVGSSVQ